MSTICQPDSSSESTASTPHEFDGDSPGQSTWPGERLLRANLAAMAERHPDVARQIESVEIPDTVEMVTAHDGRPSFRFRQEDGRRPWLGWCSMPMAAAKIQVDKINAGQGNLAIQGIGTGATVSLLLKKMALHQALLVLEPEALLANLAFRLWDFQQELLTGRLVILIGRDSQALVSEFYQSHPGYNIAEQTVNQSWLTDQQNQAFAQTMAMAMDRIARQAIGRIDELSCKLKTEQSPHIAGELAGLLRDNRYNALRVANCTNVFQNVDYSISRDVLSGFRQLGASTHWLVPDRPDQISAQVQLERLVNFNPHLIVLVNMLRHELPHTSASPAVCVTLLCDPSEQWFDGDADRSRFMGEQDWICPTCREHARLLVEIGFNADRILTLPPAVNPEFFHPIELTDSQQKQLGSEVVIVADRFSTDPETYNIQLPFHQQLFQAAVDEIRRDPSHYHRDAARQYLTRAQRCGVRLQEEDLRKHFIWLIEHYLGPSAQRDVFAEALVREGFDLKIWGVSDLKRGLTESVPEFWTESPLSGRIVGTIPPDDRLNQLYNAGTIFVHISDTGRIDRFVLDGMAAGAFFLVQSHPGNRQTKGSDQLLEPNRELITFDSPKDLVRKVRYYLDHPEERRTITEAARNKLNRQHRYVDRINTLLDVLAKTLPIG